MRSERKEGRRRRVRQSYRKGEKWRRGSERDKSSRRRMTRDRKDRYL